MSRPQRIQRRRTPGWRAPDGAIYVGRGTRWGNPFRLRKESVVEAISDHGVTVKATWTPPSAEVAVSLYREYVTEGVDTFLGASIRAEFADDIVTELAGKDLMCWCPLDQPCHADVLLALAAGEEI